MLCQVKLEVQNVVCQRRKTEERDFGFGLARNERELFHSRNLTLVPRSLLQNCTESLATQATINRQKTVKKIMLKRYFYNQHLLKNFIYMFYSLSSLLW